MKINPFAKLLLKVSIFLVAIKVSAQHERPNIILIMADDMGYECLSANGSLSYTTPNLDQLGKEGIRFTHCISQPICTPSRVKIMTGKYNFRNNAEFAYLDIRERTFGNLLKDAGYKTIVAGKWQLNGRNPNAESYKDPGRPKYFGFDEYCLWQLTYSGKAGGRYSDPLIEQNGKTLTGLDDRYGPDIFSDFVLDRITKYKDDNFFIYYPMVLVHDPFVPTPDSKIWSDKKSRKKNDVTYFKDMVQYTDKIIGKIVAKLEEEGLRENTLILFTADNGTQLGVTTQTTEGPYNGGKGTTLNAGTHVPFIANWPKVMKKGKVYNDLIEFSDFMPTLADLAGVKTPWCIDGKSFYNVLVNEKHQPRETVLVHYDPIKKRMKPTQIPGRFVRTLDYKLYQDGKFYKVSEDPLEENPLAEGKLSKKQLAIKKSLQKIQDDCPKWNPYKGNIIVNPKKKQ